MDNFGPKKFEGILDNIIKPDESDKLHEIAIEKRDTLQMARELMGKGIPMKDIPIDDYDKLSRMYKEEILHEREISESDRLYSSTAEKYLKFSNVINSLSNKNQDDLVEELSALAEIIIDNQIKTSQYETYDLSDIPMQQNIPSPEAPIENIEEEPIPDDDDDDEPIVDVKEIEHLTDKLQSVLDAMGEDLDPELINFAKKIAKEILDAFETLASDEIPEDDEITPPEEIPQENIALEQTPVVPEQIQQNIAAKIMKPTIKIAQISQYLDENNDKRFKDLDVVLNLLYKILN